MRDMSKLERDKAAKLRPLVLYYTGESKKAQQIELLCAQFGYGTRRLMQGDVNRTVGALAGLTGMGGGLSGRTDKGGEENTAGAAPEAAAGQETAPPFYAQPELMIFSGVSGEALDRFLGAWRMAGISPIPLKAILTMYNYTWTVYALTQELIREHTAMMMERRS